MIKACEIENYILEREVSGVLLIHKINNTCRPNYICSMKGVVMKVNLSYVGVIGAGAALLVSVGNAIYSYSLGKRFKAVIDVIDDYNEEVESAVEDAVNDAYEEIKADVKAELTKQILNLDISEVKKQVIDQASEKVRVKLQTVADEVLNRD